MKPRYRNTITFKVVSKQLQYLLQQNSYEDPKVPIKEIDESRTLMFNGE